MLTPPTIPAPARASKSPAEAEAFLASFEVRSLVSRETRHGIQWTAKVHRQGVLVLEVEQEGRGGANRYRGADGARVDALVEELGEAGIVLGLDPWEPVDAMTSGSSSGGTLLDGLRAALEDGA